MEYSTSIKEFVFLFGPSDSHYLSFAASTETFHHSEAAGDGEEAPVSQTLNLKHAHTLQGGGTSLKTKRTSKLALRMF